MTPMVELVERMKAAKLQEADIAAFNAMLEGIEDSRRTGELERQKKIVSAAVVAIEATEDYSKEELADLTAADMKIPDGLESYELALAKLVRAFYNSARSLQAI